MTISTTDGRLDELLRKFQCIATHHAKVVAVAVVGYYEELIRQGMSHETALIEAYTHCDAAMALTETQLDTDRNHLRLEIASLYSNKLIKGENERIARDALNEAIYAAERHFLKGGPQ